MPAQVDNVELLQMRDTFVAKMHGAFQHAYLHQSTSVQRGLKHTLTEYELVCTVALNELKYSNFSFTVERVMQVCKEMWPNYMIASCTVTQQLVREGVITDLAQPYITITLVQM